MARKLTRKATPIPASSVYRKISKHEELGLLTKNTNAKNKREFSTTLSYGCIMDIRDLAYKFSRFTGDKYTQSKIIEMAIALLKKEEIHEVIKKTLIRY